MDFGCFQVGEAMQPGWGDESNSMDDADMGNWEGSQESNSSWSSARDWNKPPMRNQV